jgi:hypothetical protein
MTARVRRKGLLFMRALAPTSNRGAIIATTESDARARASVLLDP